MNVRVAKQCAASTLCVPTRSAATYARARRGTRETRARPVVAAMSTSARYLNDLAARMRSARMPIQDTIVCVPRDTELNRIHKLLVNR